MRQAGMELPTRLEAPGAIIRGDDWGGMTYVHVEFGAGGDLAPVLKGLPDDHCPVPHWGYVLKGSLTVGYTDGRQETLRAGDLFYLPPGHTGKTDEGVTYIEFSPDREFSEVLGHVARQMQG